MLRKAKTAPIMAVHSVSLSFPVSVRCVKSWMWIYLYTLTWTSWYNTSVTGQQVIGSQDDVLVKVGDEVILPCHIEPQVNMARQTVEWSRPDLKPVYVHLLQNGHYNTADQNPLYKERTSLFPEKLQHGNISLKLTSVRLSDEGTYKCFVPHLRSSRLIKLLVGNVSQPVISSNGPADGGLSLTCGSGCWYPQPEMSWLDSDENNIPAESSVTHRPSQHCYNVQRNVTVTLPGLVTCRVHLPHINHTVATGRVILESDIPTEGGSTGAVIAGIFTLIIILVAAVLGYLYWKKKRPGVKKSPEDEEMAIPLVNQADQAITYSGVKKSPEDEEMAIPLVNQADQAITYSDLITNDEEIRIVMVGKTGAGKSATGNTILGPEAFEAKSAFKSVTTTCIKASGAVAGRKVSVIDTPGLFDTGFDNTDTIKEVIKCITCAAPGPHVFLAVIRVGRYTDEEKNVVAKIQKAFGQSSDKYTMILFTHGDQIEGSFDDMMNESPEVQELISKYNGHYHVFNNNPKDKPKDPASQVTELLEKINKMVEKNGGSHYTNQMFQEEVRRQDLKKLMYSLNLTAASSDEEKEEFVLQHRTQLIQDVPRSTVMSIVDSLGTRVHPDLYAEIKAAGTHMDQMKTLYTSLLDPGDTSVRAAFCNALTQQLSETPVPTSDQHEATDAVSMSSSTTSTDAKAEGVGPSPERRVAKPGEKHFVDQNRQFLIHKVTKLALILDELLGIDAINQEGYNTVMTATPNTSQDKMRALYTLLQATWAKNVFQEALEKHESDLLKELEKPSSDDPSNMDIEQPLEGTISADVRNPFKKRGPVEDKTKNKIEPVSVPKSEKEPEDLERQNESQQESLRKFHQEQRLLLDKFTILQQQLSQEKITVEDIHKEREQLKVLLVAKEREEGTRGLETVKVQLRSTLESTMGDNILKALNVLTKDDFGLFKWWLQRVHVEGFEPIPEGDLEEATRTITSRLITKTYPRHGNEVMLTVLMQIQRHDLLMLFTDKNAGPPIRTIRTVAKAGDAGPWGTRTRSTAKVPETATERGAVAGPSSSRDVTEDMRQAIHFVDQNRDILIQKVTNVKPILDMLNGMGFITDEIYFGLRHKTPGQEMMRELLDLLNTKIPAKCRFYKSLEYYEPNLFDELKKLSG